MFIVYVLKSEVREKSYVGMTNDIVRRVTEHNSGMNFYTKQHKPWRVIYTEAYDTLESARKRERYFKSAAGRRFLKKNIFKNQ